jgi:hypothetical protein
MAYVKMDKLADSASKDIQSKLGISDEVADKLNRLYEGAKLDGVIDEDVCFDIINGYGHGELDKTTWGVTIDGNFTITSPDNGTWHIIAKDGDKVIFDVNGIKKGNPIHIHYKTGFKLHLKVEAWWSEGGNTKLCLHIHASY